MGDHLRTPDFASSKIQDLLNDLATKSHNAKVRSITNFMSFIKTSKPEVYDDDVDILLTGLGEDEDGEGEGERMGLLGYAGAVSENSKDAMSLKRISADAIDLLHWLVFLPSDVIAGMCEGYYP